MRKADRATNLALQFASLNEHLSAGGEQALQRLVDLAVDTVTGCDWAAITSWPEDGSPHSLAYSADVAKQVDLLQYELGSGPCLSAADLGASVYIPDVGTEDRWIEFCQAAGEQSPVRCVLSLYLGSEPGRTALNLYGDQSAAFNAEAVNTAALFAAHARVLMSHAASTDANAELTNALNTSRQIGTAIGILMNVHDISSEEAFERLTISSQELNRKLRDVADDVTRTGTLPAE